jgi:uncharacterized protein YbjT (DUF2867 family)
MPLLRPLISTIRCLGISDEVPNEDIMRILILGARGFIGSAVAARLASHGHQIVGIGRREYNPGLIDIEWECIDIAKAVKAEQWSGYLTGMDAVVNCAGVLQDAPNESTAGVHEKGIAALFEACESAGVRRVVHLSAVGVDRETPTEFSRTKWAGDQALMATSLDWVILRPSVVIDRSTYGGSALMRGLAALPIMPIMPQTAPLQVIYLDDLVEAVIRFLDHNAPARVAIDLVGPKRQAFEEIVGLIRQWMRWSPARRIGVPLWLAYSAYRLGDAVALLGWRPSIRTTARREMARGAIGDPSRLSSLIHIEPRALEEALKHEPASVQERWFARMYFLKPVVLSVLAIFWIATGLISLGPGWDRGVELVMEGRTGETLAKLAVLSGARLM